MQTELSLRMLGPISAPRDPNYEPIKEGLKLLNTNIETESVDCYFNQLSYDPYTFDDLWFLESSYKIISFLEDPYPAFSNWYQEIDFNQRREILQFSLRVFLFQPILQQLLDMCSFFGANLCFSNCRPMVYIVLYKFIEQKFNYRPKLSNPSHSISKICHIIQKCRVRLNAELAKLRVEEGATTLLHLLSEESRQRLDTQSNTVLYLRTTKLFTETLESCPECSIMDILYRFGLVGAASIEELLDVSATSRKLKYKIINNDLVAVSVNSFSYFAQHSLTKQGYLQLVDISTYNLITYASRDINPSEDVVLTHYGSGAECIQLSECLIEDATLHVFSTDDIPSATNILAQYQINNVVLCRESFGENNEIKASISNVKTILCFPPNSRESVKSKLLHALTDVTCLPALFHTCQLDIVDIITEQKRIVAYSLQMKSVDNVYYFVHSTKPIETCETVTTELDSHRENANSLKQRIFNIKPVIHGSFCPASDGFLTVAGSVEHSGYFAASLVRRPPPPAPKPMEIIEKAVYDGVIQLCDTDVEYIRPKKTGKVKKHPKIKPLFSTSTPSEIIPMTFTSRQKVTAKHLFTTNLNTKPLHWRPFR
ncbi:Methyltransferase NSUN7 isoform X1 [Oopsacas minuta]|uniref:Methyltransferase NSUN7 isoform X1 n=1 Tax=Oopsacas minuta TaxID=111878 RepID=A0AAV7JAY9_9METZ|nr:Methyltransferase NSUN7 isoform X1 [Oopsacas minuta]